MSSSLDNLPTECDYLVVGGGATGMAFVDTLRRYKAAVSIVMVDAHHEQPGGHWHDTYSFCRLHQPSQGYGVETVKLEQSKDDLASRTELLQYYQRVGEQWQTEGNFWFVGHASVDLQQCAPNATVSILLGDKVWNLKAQKVVDARYLQPDLPCRVPPTFQFDASVVRCLASNDLVTALDRPYYVVVGGGKTGMDAVLYLLQNDVVPNQIRWIVPRDAWWTARENIGNCIELLHTCLQKGGDWQTTFQQWHTDGKVYKRSTNDTLPSVFKDATVDRDECQRLQAIPVLLGHRLKEIRNSGDLVFADGHVLSLPWKVSETTFVHCTAGAFDYSAQRSQPSLPSKETPFAPNAITIHDVYGTPGFCFVGSLFGKLESLDNLTDEQKNQMCLSSTAGNMDVISKEHPYVQRFFNLKRWMQVPELKQWLLGHRLFHMGHVSGEELDGLVDDISRLLQEQHGIV